MTRRVEIRRPRRTERGAVDTPTSPKRPLEPSGATKTPEVAPDTGAASGGPPEPSTGRWPRRFVATEEAHGLAPGVTIGVDGHSYVLAATRLRCGQGYTPPYFGLLIGDGDPLPTVPLAVEATDGRTIAWVSHLRATIEAPPYRTARVERRTWTARRGRGD